jgi:hypothetical protein
VLLINLLCGCSGKSYSVSIKYGDRDYNFGISAVVPFVSDTEVSFGYGNMLRGLNVRPTRASMFIYASEDSSLYSLEMEIVFYDTNKSKVDSAVIVVPVFESSSFHEIKFSYPELTSYIRIKYINVNRMNGSISKCVQNDGKVAGVKCKINGNKLDIKYNVDSEKFVNLMDSSGDTVELLRINGKNSESLFVDYGATCFSVLERK